MYVNENKYCYTNTESEEDANKLLAKKSQKLFKLGRLEVHNYAADL